MPDNSSTTTDNSAASTDNSAATKKIPGPQVGMLWFFIITSIYLPLKYMNYSPESENNSSLIYNAIYILLIIIGEYFINLNITTELCGDTQWSTAISVTIIPWIIIFGLMNIMLILFPGWLTPFSNTFGYGVAYLMGVGDIFVDILKKPDDTDELGETKQALARILGDKAIMINEIPGTADGIDGFRQYLQQIQPLLEKPYDTANFTTDDGLREYIEYKPDSDQQDKLYQLFSLVRMKNLIAEYIWYLLTGALVTSVGYNYIINSGCKLSSKEMQRRHDEYVIKEKQREKNKTKPSIYSSAQPQ